VRLLTRSDFDGLVCAALLQELGIVDEIAYIHPKDLQDNKINITKNDVIANAPYVEGCGLWFDHHSSEHERLKITGRFTGASELAPSAAQVIYDYYKNLNGYHKRLKQFKTLVEVASVVDSAQFARDDILNPSGWNLLAFITDPRTGLGRKHGFRISNFELMKQLPALLCTKTVEEILAEPDFQERVQVYLDGTEKYRLLLVKRCAIKGSAIVIDLRGIKEAIIGNRFLEYVLFPEQNISIRISDGRDNQFAVINLGHSIINKTSKVNVGSLTLQYGGGGHRQVGACQVSYENADKIVQEMLDVINSKA